MTPTTLATARALVGLGQGVVLYLLQQAVVAKIWPTTDEFIFAPLLAASVFVPIIIVAGLGNFAHPDPFDLEHCCSRPVRGSGALCRFQ